MPRFGIFNMCAFNIKVHALIYKWKKNKKHWNDKILCFLLYIGENLTENINYYRFYWHKCVLRKKCHAMIFLNVILFSAWQKTSTWSESMHKWPRIDHLIWLTWNSSVWYYKWGRHLGHSYSRRKLPVLHHEINNVCCTLEEISCRQMGIGVKSLSHQTAMPQRLYGVLKICQRAVGSPQNTSKISNLPVIACTQRPHIVPTVFTRRSHSVYIASMALLRCCSVFKAHSQRAHSVLTAIIAFKTVFTYFFFILSNLFCEQSDIFLLFEAIRHI